MVENTQTGKNTPTLYNMYGKQYNFEDLQRKADSELDMYISTLKRGEKDYDKLVLAYLDLMGGIKDGTIVFENGMYNDSLGRYRNKQGDKNKDVYGLMANYIYKQQNRLKEYTPPTDPSKIKWNGNLGIGQAITRNIFNSDKGNLDDFLDLDELNPETNTRDTKMRINKLNESFLYIYDNFDNIFTGFNESDKNNSLNYINDAITALSDGKITSNEYLALGRAAGGLDFRTMLASTILNKSIDDSKKDDQTPENASKNFEKWVHENYPRYTGTLKNGINIQSPQKLGSWTDLTLDKSIGTLSEKECSRIVKSILSGKGYRFKNEKFLIKTFGLNYVSFDNMMGLSKILKSMKTRGYLVPISLSDPDLFFIPGTITSKNTAWVWNYGNNTISEVDIHTIPYIRNKIKQKYLSQSGSDQANSDNLVNLYSEYIQSNKKGGILKATEGNKLWYSGINDYDPNNYMSNYDITRLVNGDMSDNNFDPYISNVSGLGKGRYKASEGNNRDNVIKIEQSPYYINFGKDILNEKGEFTPEGIVWAKLVDANLPKGSLASFFDENGNLRTEWSTINKDLYGRSPQTFKNLRDYVNYVRNDNILGSRHNVLLKQGTRYFYKDKDGKEHWVSPEDAKNYTISENPVRSTWGNDNTVYWNDYEVTGFKKNLITDEALNEEELNEGKFSKVFPRGGDPNKSSNTENTVSNQIPNILEFARLIKNIRSNEKLTEILKQDPVLIDPFLESGIILGDFSTRLEGARQGGVDRTLANIPLTSDAITQSLRQRLGNEDAEKKERQANQIDVQAIRKSVQENVARQNRNAERRINVANTNLKSIADTINYNKRLKAILEKADNSSITNYIEGLETRHRTKNEENLERYKNFNYKTKAKEIELEYTDITSPYINALSEYKKLHGSYTNMPEYDQYQDFINEMAKYKLARLDKLEADLYGYSYDNPYLHTTPNKIRSGFSFKNGGVLIYKNRFIL